jgi:hypothetical protein
MDGHDIQTVTVSLPGKMARAFSYELDGKCVDELCQWVKDHPKSSAPVEVTF